VLVHTRVVKAVITTKMNRGGNRGFSKTGVNCSTLLASSRRFLTAEHEEQQTGQKQHK
jgi:hypothetical protein